MPRRFFKPLSRQRHRLRERWFMRPFKVILEHPVYWTLNRRNVTRAFALGLFIAFVPLPIHFLLAALLALAMRLNVPAAVAGTLLTNPLTLVPLYYTAYWIGARLLAIPARPIAIEMSWEWLSTVLPIIWRPFLLGCAVMGILCAVAGYLVIGGLWHVTLVMKYHKRKNAGGAKDSENLE
jgi:uncharacterized protein (DUF2062 family)